MKNLLPIPRMNHRGLLSRLSLVALILISTELVSTSATAQPAASLQTQAGYYRMKLGNSNVTALSDGTLPLTHNFLTNTTTAELDQLLGRAKVPYPIETSVNAYLIEMGTRLILVDTGAGELMGPSLGQLPASLRAAGYQAAQVTDILLTHIHSDHSGGLAASGQRLFPNATVHVSQAEHDYWLSDANLAKAPSDGKMLALDRKFFLEARTKMEPYVRAGQVKTFAGNAEVVPGIRATVGPGHTPGHTYYMLESQGQKLLFAGDMIHAAAVQFINPVVTFISDVDTKAAIAVRRQALGNAAQQGYWVAFAHVSFPGVGHLRANGPSYDWLPINYSTTMTGQ